MTTAIVLTLTGVVLLIISGIIYISCIDMSPDLDVNEIFGSRPK